MKFSSKRYKINLFFSNITSFLIASLLSLAVYTLNKNSDYILFIITISFLLIYFFLVLFLTRKFRNRKRILKEKFPNSWIEILETSVYYYSKLSSDKKESFENMIQIFLGEKIITGIKTEVDDFIKILIASSAVIPVFNIPDWEYDKIGEILLYPDNFNDNFDFSSSDDPILGMVFSNSSTMIFSKPALIESFKKHNDSFNVGIHEFVHKIDGEDGVIDGIPALLMDKKSAQEYIKIANEIIQEIESGKSDINPYALTNISEFFAVICEMFFENPKKLMGDQYEMYNILKKVFKQDTFSIFKSEARSMFRSQRGNNKIGRNSPCLCGSGKKFKKCCLNK